MIRTLFCLLLSMAILYSGSIYAEKRPLGDLSQYEKRVYSQNGEDGIIEKIFELIGVDSAYFVEFGVEDGRECNTRYLREKYGWTGLMMDSDYQNLMINLQQEKITAENVVGLFQLYGVPEEFDLLSIDIDFNDFHVWKALLGHYHPRVVVIEYNSSHSPWEDKVIIYDPNGRWDHSNYFGASILSLYKLGRKYGYSLVYADKKGVNIFFIRDDVLAQCPYRFKHINRLEYLFKPPQYGPYNGGHPQDLLNREYVQAEDLLR